MSFTPARSQVVKLSDLSPALVDISAACHPQKTKWSPKNPRPDTTTLGQSGSRNQGLLGVRDATLSIGGLMKFSTIGSVPIHGRNTVLLFDQYPLKAYIQSGSYKRSIVTPPTNCLGDAYVRRAVLGLQSAKVNFSGLYDSQASGIDARFRAMGAASAVTVHTAAPNGCAVGQLVDLVQIVNDGFDIGGDQGGAVPIAGSFMNDDVYDTGVSLHDLTAEVGVVNGTSVDETAVSTTGGWVAHLHVTAIAGGTATIKLQDSADNVTFADLASGSFGAVAAVGGTRLDGGTSATVRRYVRVIISAMTASSVTFVVGFARRTYVDATMAAGGTHRCFAGLLTVATSPTFSYGPEGSTTGKQRISGSVRPASYDWNFSTGATIDWAMSLPIDNTFTEDTYP